eukprot:Em0001g301a
MIDNRGLIFNDSGPQYTKCFTAHGENIFVTLNLPQVILGVTNPKHWTICCASSNWRPHLLANGAEMATVVYGGRVSGGTQESEKVRQYLKGRLQLELGSDVTNQREVLLLCCTLSDVEERVERLLEAGFSEEWAAILLPLFPPLWDVDVTHMRRVLELLEERGFGGNALKKIVSEHSYLLMEDRQLIERRLSELLEMGFEQQQIVSIFTAHPLLFGFSLGRDTIHTIRELQGKHFGSKWVASALLHCLEAME